MTLKIPHDALVFVGDGRRALFLRNEGDEAYPNLKTEQVLKDENPATREQGTDRPGRSFARAGDRSRSAVEQTDWHEIEEHRFVKEVAAALEDVVRSKKVKSLVIAAPARALGDLRKALHDDVKRSVVAEIDKDFTRQPIWEIEKHILAG